MLCIITLALLVIVFVGVLYACKRIEKEYQMELSILRDNCKGLITENENLKTILHFKSKDN